MKSVLLILTCAAVGLLAGDAVLNLHAPAPAAVVPGRFQIVQTSSANDLPQLIRLDTATGQTWTLRSVKAGPQDDNGERAVLIGWAPISENIGAEIARWNPLPEAPHEAPRGTNANKQP